MRMMASLDNGGVLPPSRYSTAHEFASPYAQCSTSDGATTALCDDSVASCASPHCNDTNKTPNAASTASLNQTSTPSPGNPSANSWPGFGGKSSRIDQIQASVADNANKSPAPAFDVQLRRPTQSNGERVFVFSSKMANEAVGSRFESIVAWHEVNCPPSTSCETQMTEMPSHPGRRSEKRKSADSVVRSPAVTNGSSSSAIESPSVPRPESESGSQAASGEQSASSFQNPSSELLALSEDESHVDNPLRRMERMTQDSLFEPPAKVCRATSSGETNHSSRRSGDQERNTKLEKIRSLEQQLIDKHRSDLDRMAHEQEANKMAQMYSQPMMQCYPSGPAVLGAPPPYQVPSPHPLNPMHAVYRRPQFISHVPNPQGMSPAAAPPNAMMGGTMAPVNMAMGQSIRPSMNPPPYSMHIPPEEYMPYGYPQASFPGQGYASGMSPGVSPAYSPMYAPMNGAPIPPRGYAMYGQGMRAIYAAEKIVPPDMWSQQLPQPLSNLEARIPSQKIQYNPNGTVIDENLNDSSNNMNSLFG